MCKNLGSPRSVLEGLRSLDPEQAGLTIGAWPELFAL